jgi:TRAP-type C4-dicarboxylate transport system permease small subunit
MNGKGIFDRVLFLLAFLTGVMLSFVVIIKFIDIILRYFLNRPLTWDVEVTEYLLFTMTFFGTAWLLSKGGHVRIDLIDNFLGERKKKYLHLVHATVGALVSGILTVTSFISAVYSYRDGLKVVKIYAVGKHYFLLIISFGFFMLFVEFLRQWAENLRKVRAEKVKEGG